ncbi:S49 family peptidase [Roseibium salinum]|nr:S49 family peptidase [Roseibium salinum]
MNDSYEWFVSLVVERRALEPARARELSDGRILIGQRALDAKLVDAIGGEDEAIAWLESEKGVAKDLPVVTWRISEGLDELPFSSRISREFGKRDRIGYPRSY